MKRIIGLSIAAVLLIGVTAGGVWAFIADLETSYGNGLTAGTLDLVSTVNATASSGNVSYTAGGNTLNGNATFTKMRPGDTGSLTWTLVNNGTLLDANNADIHTHLTIASTATFTENGSNEIETLVSGNNGGSNGDLDEFVGVKLIRNNGGIINYILGSAGNYAPLSLLESTLDAENQTVASLGTVTYELQWSVAATFYRAGTDNLFGTGDDTGPVNSNIIQSDTAQIDITFTLSQ